MMPLPHCSHCCCANTFVYVLVRVPYDALWLIHSSAPDSAHPIHNLSHNATHVPRHNAACVLDVLCVFLCHMACVFLRLSTRASQHQVMRHPLRPLWWARTGTWHLSSSGAAPNPRQTCMAWGQRCCSC